MIVRTSLSLEPLAHICANLREWDRREIFATCWTDDPAELAERTMRTGEFSWLFWLNGNPVAAIGAAPLWPGMWSMWAFGTDDFRQVALSLTKHCKRFIIPALFNAGLRRAEAHSMAGHEEAHSWMLSLGAIAERRIPDFGKNGEEFIVFSWPRAHLARRFGLVDRGATGNRPPVSSH